MISEEAKLLGEVARDVLRNAGDVDAWDLLVDNEWIGVAIAPEHGGHGGTLAEAAALTEAAGATASGAPVLEAVLAAVAAGTCRGGRELVRRFAEGEERAVLAPGVIRGAQTTHVTVPWVPQATTLLVVVEPDRDGDGEARLARLAVADLAVAPREAIAAMTEGVVALGPIDLQAHLLEGAVDRPALINATGVLTAARLKGAIYAVQALTLAHARVRKQFGATLASFQAVAHAAARQAGLAELTNAAVQAALDRSGSRGVQAAVAARVIAGNAAREVARIAHQVHGAIGVTREYELHRFTLAMQAWRDAYGTARCWEAYLGHSMVGQGERFWDEAAPDTAVGARS
jgi:alkylation response protein AidB-like acyl-CoA dehydrogenase